MASAPRPDGLLGEIVARKRLDVAARLGDASLDDLRAIAERTTRSLAAALARPGVRFVMEVKRASPSGGTINRDADPEAQARAYRAAADVISVLTDTPYFSGSLDDLAVARRGFDGPILAKDFIVDLRQVAEARIHGADAVLAILSVLGPEGASEVMEEARRLGMDVLVEAHGEAELRQAVALGAPLIGINNRNLSTLRIDLGETERLAKLVPADRILVSESGIADRADVERLAPLVDAFLVGSSLMKASDPALAARSLAFGRVKICGLTSAEDARAVAAAGASFAGMVMVPNTPRAVTRAEALPIAAAAREAGLRTVGVFRNERLMEVALTTRALGLDVVQLHGEEDPDYASALRNLLEKRIEIWGVAPVDSAAPTPRAGVDRTLFDTSRNGRSGGTGAAFDWALLDGQNLGEAILAGGLNPDNAVAAAATGAFALDLCSGVEAAPGCKDPAKLGAFFEALRPLSRQEIQPCA